jgi:hypothetical protein
MAKSGASKGAKKINAFNDGVLDGVNVALNQGPVSNVKVYDDLPGGEKRVLPDLGAGRIGNVRLKKGKV